MALIHPEVTCRCPNNRRPPLRVDPDAAYAVRELLNGHVEDAVLLTYRCYSCSTIIEIHLSDLALIQKPT